MNYYYFIILLFFSIMLIGNVNAATSFIFKQNNPAILELPVVNNDNSQCTACTCTITINYPNGSAMITNAATLFANGYADYSMTQAQMAILGFYKADLNCNDGTNYGVSTFEYQITSTGTEFTTAQGILYVVFLFASIIIFLLVSYGAVAIPFRNNRNNENTIISINNLKYVKMFLIVIAYLILMLSLGLLRGITSNYIPEIGVDIIFNWLFWIMLSFLFPLIVVSLLFMVILLVTDKKIMKALKRGIPIR